MKPKTVTEVIPEILNTRPLEVNEILRESVEEWFSILEENWSSWCHSGRLAHSQNACRSAVDLLHGCLRDALKLPQTAGSTSRRLSLFQPIRWLSLYIAKG